MLRWTQTEVNIDSTFSNCRAPDTKRNTITIGLRIPFAKRESLCKPTGLIKLPNPKYLTGAYGNSPFGKNPRQLILVFPFFRVRLHEFPALPCEFPPPPHCEFPAPHCEFPASHCKFPAPRCLFSAPLTKADQRY